MTLGPIVGLPAALRHGLLTQSQGEDAALGGDKPPTAGAMGRCC